MKKLFLFILLLPLTLHAQVNRYSKPATQTILVPTTANRQSSDNEGFYKAYVEAARIKQAEMEAMRRIEMEAEEKRILEEKIATQKCISQTYDLYTSFSKFPTLLDGFWYEAAVIDRINEGMCISRKVYVKGGKVTAYKSGAGNDLEITSSSPIKEGKCLIRVKYPDDTILTFDVIFLNELIEVN